MRGAQVERGTNTPKLPLISPCLFFGAAAMPADGISCNLFPNPTHFPPHLSIFYFSLFSFFINPDSRRRAEFAQRIVDPTSPQLIVRSRAVPGNIHVLLHTRPPLVHGAPRVARMLKGNACNARPSAPLPGLSLLLRTYVWDTEWFKQMCEDKEKGGSGSSNTTTGGQFFCTASEGNCKAMWQAR